MTRMEVLGLDEEIVLKQVGDEEMHFVYFVLSVLVTP
jgi:hypothetical protein